MFCDPLPICTFNWPYYGPNCQVLYATEYVLPIFLGKSKRVPRTLPSAVQSAARPNEVGAKLSAARPKEVGAKLSAARPKEVGPNEMGPKLSQMKWGQSVAK